MAAAASCCAAAMAAASNAAGEQGRRERPAAAFVACGWMRAGARCGRRWAEQQQAVDGCA